MQYLIEFSCKPYSRIYKYYNYYLYSFICNLLPKHLSKILHDQGLNFTGKHPTKKYRPFTFSPLQFQYKLERDQYVVLSDTISFIFSTVDPRIGLTLINALYKENKFKIDDLEIQLKNVVMLDEILIGSEMLLSATNVCLTEHDYSTKRTYYVFPSDEQYYFLLQERLKTRYEAFVNKKYTPLTFEIVNLKNSLDRVSSDMPISDKCNILKENNIFSSIYPYKAENVNNTTINYRVFSYDIIVRGDPEEIKFIYDFGIGEKQHQGFGWVRQKEC